MKQPLRWLMDEPGYGRSPEVCVDRSGRVWVAWISWTVDGECVRFSTSESQGEWTASKPVCEPRPMVTAISVAPWKDGVVVAWIDGGDPDSDGLKIKFLGSDTEGDSRLIMPWRRGPAHPCVAASKSSTTLAWTFRRLGGRKVAACFGYGPEDLGDQMEISPGGGFNVRPAVTCSDKRAVIVWEAASNGLSRIVARRIVGGELESDPIEIESVHKGVLAMPAVAAASGGGSWIAWQSNVDPKNGPGLVRWIETANLGADRMVRRPSAAMPGVNRNEEGEDQGFEAPSLAVLEDGRLIIAGRGSQSVRLQILGSQGWSSIERIDEEGWKCRGRRFCVCPYGEGILVAGRESDGIAVRSLVIGDGWTGRGEPKLGRAKRRSKEKTPSPPPDYEHIIAGNRVLFGDIHQHTAASDGTGTSEETYSRARYRYRDDMVAVADHESFLGKRTPPGEWAETCRAADEVYKPGAFVTLHAFEWTGKMHPGPGHKVVYLPPDGGPVYSREQVTSSTSKGLIAECRRIGALVVPHHVGWTGADMESHDPDVQACFEIVSCHGAYERPGVGRIGTRGDDKEGQFVAEALDKGLRFGLIGGSDGHGLNWHHGVCRVKDSHRSGLTGVFSKEVSREGVLEALRRRCCYATSGAKIGLWFEIDGRPMGEELVIGAPVPFRVVVATSVDLESLALVTNSGAEIELEASGLEADVRGTLPPPPVGGWCYYFVRVIREDGETAWSSPIWMDAPNSA